MKIQRLRVRRVTGTMTTNGPLWEERLVRPIDVYPEHRRDPWRTGASRSTTGTSG
jgi:L-rhamnonate dehydratase